MDQAITMGLDVAKHVFQVDGIDASGSVVVRRKLRRSEVLAFFERAEPCLVGIEACATARHWARAIGAFGHEVRLMPANYVRGRFESRERAIGAGGFLIQAVDVDRTEPWPDGQDRQEDQALPV